MIKILETPQFSNLKYIYEIKDDILTITMNDKEEVFDFSELLDGVAEQIEVENIQLNPVVHAEKKDGIIEVILIRFYDTDEKEVFENGED